MSTIATLPIPNPGNYVIFAKVVLHYDVNSGADIACQLVAGAEVDQSQSILTGNTAGFTSSMTAAMNVVHDFTASGSALLQCAGFGVDTDASWIKITAIHVRNLTNAAST